MFCTSSNLLVVCLVEYKNLWKLKIIYSSSHSYAVKKNILKTFAKIIRNQPRKIVFSMNNIIDKRLQF